jgi:dTMP kinase
MTIENFIVFEGGDGSGTTTQLHLLKEKFESIPHAPPLWITAEPTDGPIGKLIRAALRRDITVEPETLAYLFAADRREHIFGETGVIEQCGRGAIVVSDRYTPSSLVYQGISCGETLPAMLNQPFPAPETLFFFDVDPEIAVKRMENRPIKEIYEYLDFQRLARERYKALVPKFAAQGSKIIVIDASQDIKTISEAVWSEIKNRIQEPRYAQVN